MHQANENSDSDATYDVYAVSRCGQLFNRFRLTWLKNGVRTLVAAKSCAERLLTDNAGSELVIIVTEGSESDLGETQRLVLTKLSPVKRMLPSNT